LLGAGKVAEELEVDKVLNSDARIAAASGLLVAVLADVALFVDPQHYLDWLAYLGGPGMVSGFVVAETMEGSSWNGFWPELTVTALIILAITGTNFAVYSCLSLAAVKLWKKFRRVEPRQPPHPPLRSE